MKKKCLFVVLILQIFTHVFAEETPVGKEIYNLLATVKDLPGWQTTGEPYHAVGDELYQMIDGAAEIYQEYGFKQAISEVYKNQNQKSFNLEIFEMQNAAAAYGVYTFKTGNQGRTISMGTEGFFEEYYLNFWKGPYEVTITGFDSEKETVAAILLAAQKVDEKIKIENKKPEMINVLPGVLKDQLKPNGIKYIRGNMALFNSYIFDYTNIYGVKEGVIGEYRDFKLFFFKYTSNDECRKWFNNGSNFLKKSSRFKYLSSRDGIFSVIDDMNNNIHAEIANRYLFIVISAEQVDKNIIKQIRANIRK